MIFFLILAFILLVLIIAYLHERPKFGRIPHGKRLRMLRNSRNYRNGSFQNLLKTPQFTGNSGQISIIKDIFFRDRKILVPAAPLPSVKTDLRSLPDNGNLLVWFGHSSYFLKMDGINILVDPVLSGSAAPFSFMMKAFPGTDIYSPDDFPQIDYLFITHDHWDHLDYLTLKALKHKIGTVVCGLGVGAHFEYWGFDAGKIIENDWNHKFQLNEKLKVATAATRHFSGRTFHRNVSLWTSFILETENRKFYLGGDSGYGPHFKTIGDTYGPFDLAVLENGQYNEHWRFLHMFPDEVLLAAQDLRARNLLPVHSAKFVLSTHAWDEPLKKITRLNNGTNLRLLTPKIGQVVFLDDESQKFANWWERI